MSYLFIRLLLIGAAIWFGLKLYRKWKLQQSGRVNPPRGQDQFEPTVRCSRCGVHLPASAVSDTGLCGKCSG